MEDMYGNPDSLMIMETRFGPCLIGRAPEKFTGNYECGIFNVGCMSLEKVEDDNLWKTAEAETAGIKNDCDCNKKSDEEILFDSCMKDAWSFDKNGRFEVKLPWKMDPINLPNNRNAIQNRSSALEKRLSKDSNISQLFEEQVKEMIAVGVLRKTDANYPRRYIPLLAVVNLKRESTKVRVCLDSKTQFSGISLNDTLLKGKYVMSDILQIVTRFRSGKYTLIGDISKMFWQIKINEHDQKYHGVIFKGETYVFTRVCFGNKPSPPIAELSMIKVAEHGKTSHPNASQALLFNRYMDDILDPKNNEKKLKDTRDEIDELIGEFGFNIKEWRSNNANLGSNVKSKKILGIQYNIQNDNLIVDIEPMNKCQVTKRKILSRIAEIWDPLGITAGVLMSGKLLLQSITRLNFSWDQIIDSDEILSEWRRWNAELDNCKDLLISLSILPFEEFAMENLKGEIIGYCDGSNVGYGSVNYLRWKNDDESIIDVKFLCAKAKVAPITGNTIPRNELCGALTLARLTWSVSEALKKTDEFKDIFVMDAKLHTGSTTVLCWVNSTAVKYKPYVKNKVVEIQNLTPSMNWRYLPSKKNKAADLLSKGCTRKELDIIVNGPDIIRKPNCKWSITPGKKGK